MRKSVFATFTAAAAVAAALLLTGCERAVNMAGKPVEFSAGISDGRSESGTRVVYGEISGEEGSKKQPLEWKVNDLITIYCAQCESKKSAGYKVTEVESLKTNLDSYAGIVNAETDGIGLRWGTGSHTFYAVYPKADGTGTTINGKDITGVIPAEQSFTEVSGTDDQIVAPDMNNMYMVSKAGTYEPDASPVTLVFQPLSTALEFTITNKFDDTESAMIVNSISLVSTGHALSGGFAVDMDQNGSYGRPKTTLASGTTVADNNTVTIDFGDDPVTVAYGKTLNFTFFLNPGNEEDEVNDLTFVINGTNAGNSETFTRRAKLENSSKVGIIIPTHQKTIISGLMVPEGVAWTVNYTPTVEQWNNGGNTPSNPEPLVDDSQPVVTSWDTDIDEDIDLNIREIPEDALPYVFSVSETNKVYFSKGNLQATFNGTGYDWGFAEHQYDCVGGVAYPETESPLTGNNRIDNQQVGDVVDLFGYSCGSLNNYGITALENYGEFKDWGETIDDGKTWRSLTEDEWDYLLLRRYDPYDYSALSFGWTMYGDIAVLVIYADNYTGGQLPETVTSIPDGVVFLPYGGQRVNNSITGSTMYRYYGNVVRNFNYPTLRWSGTNESRGCSVRLVTDVN